MRSFDNKIKLIEPEHRYELENEPEIEYTMVTSYEKHNKNVKNFINILSQYGFKYWKTGNDKAIFYENGDVTARIDIIYVGGNHANFDDFQLKITFLPFFENLRYK